MSFEGGAELELELLGLDQLVHDLVTLFLLHFGLLALDNLVSYLPHLRNHVVVAGTTQVENLLAKGFPYVQNFDLPHQQLVHSELEVLLLASDLQFLQEAVLEVFEALDYQLSLPMLGTFLKHLSPRH